jgi:hypothetical protein
MKWGIFVLLFVIGLLLGHGLLNFSKATTVSRVDRESENSSERGRKLRRQEASTVKMERMLRAELGTLDETISLENRINQLDENRLSPQRLTSLGDYRIQSMGIQQLTDAFKNGEIQTLPELAKTVSRLTKENPEEIWDLVAVNGVGFSSLDSLHVVWDAMLQGLVKIDSPGTLAKFKKMEQSLHRGYLAKKFSMAWAVHEPSTAAHHFKEMTDLISGGGAADFATEIVKSWDAKDPAALNAHIQNLPVGSERQLFEKALQQLKQKPKDAKKLQSE